MKMVFKNYKSYQIQHSDRGAQYISKDNIELLKTNKSEIFMAISAQDNTDMEKMNKTIKKGYLNYSKIKNYE